MQATAMVPRCCGSTTDSYLMLVGKRWFSAPARSWCCDSCCSMSWRGGTGNRKHNLQTEEFMNKFTVRWSGRQERRLTRANDSRNELLTWSMMVGCKNVLKTGSWKLLFWYFTFIARKTTGNLSENIIVSEVDLPNRFVARRPLIPR